MPTAISRARWPRRLLVGLSILAAATAVLEWIEWPFLRAPLESALRHGLQREVSVGQDFGVRFVGGLRLRTDLLTIGSTADGPTRAGQAPELLRATRIRLALSYSTLWSAWAAHRDPARPRAPLYVSLLAADELKANLLRDTDGRANWRFGPASEAGAQEDEPLRWPRVGELGLRHAEVLVDDARERLRIEASLRSAAQAPATGGVELVARGQYRGQPLSLEARTGELTHLVTGLTGDAPPAAQWLTLWLKLRLGRNEFDFDGRTRAALELSGVEGSFRLAGESLAAIGRPLGVTLPTTAPFQMRGKLDKEGPVWAVHVDHLALGSSRLEGNFRYDPTPSVPKLTGVLSGARLSMPDLGPALGGRVPAAEPARRTARERVLPQREFDIPSLAAMEADVAVALDEFHLGTAQLESVSPLRAHIVLAGQVLRLDDIAARSAEGALSGAIWLDARPETRGSPLWRADLRWSGVQLDRFVRPRNAAETDKRGGYVSGTLDGRTKLQGSGRTMAQVLGSLDGEMQTWVRDGGISHFLVELMGLDLAQALGVFVRGDDMLPMQCAVTALKVREGQVHTELMVIETRDSTLDGNGVISLADEKLGLVFRALPKDMTLVSLRSPVLVDGSFAEPTVRLDKTAIGKRLAAAAALAALTPLAGLLALIDLGEPQKHLCEDAIRRVRKPAP